MFAFVFILFYCVDVVCLERKWTYQCPNLGLFGFPAHFFYLFGVDVLVSRSMDFLGFLFASTSLLYLCCRLTLLLPL